MKNMNKEQIIKIIKIAKTISLLDSACDNIKLVIDSGMFANDKYQDNKNDLIYSKINIENTLKQLSAELNK